MPPSKSLAAPSESDVSIIDNTTTMPSLTSSTSSSQSSSSPPPQQQPSLLVSSSSSSPHPGNDDDDRNNNSNTNITSTSHTNPTTAINRGINDLHLPTWLGFIAISSVIRTTLQHPLNVALARKRIVQDGHVTLRDVFVDAFCTDKGKGKMAGAVVSNSTHNSPICDQAKKGGGEGVGVKKQKLSIRGLVVGADGKCFKSGFNSLYRGYITAVVGNAIGEMIYLTVVETVKGATTTAATAATGTSSSKESSSSDTKKDGNHQQQHQQPSIDAAQQATADAIAGVSGDLVAMSIAVPLSVALNRQMTAGYGLNSAGEYKTLRRTLRDLWREHQPRASSSSISPPLSGMQRAQYGLRGLYTGLSMSLFALPATGIWWATYGLAKRSLYGIAGPTLERLEAERHRAAAEASAKGAAALQQRASSIQNEKRGDTEQRQGGGGGGDGGGSGLAIHPHSSPYPLPVIGSAVAEVQSSAVALASHNWFLSPTDNPLLNATAGVAATTITTIIYNPVNVIRTRLQSLPPADHNTGDHVSASSSRPRANRRVIGLCKDLLHKEGVRGFFKGTTLNLSVAVFDGVLFSTVYELGKLSSDRGRLGVD